MKMQLHTELPDELSQWVFEFDINRTVVNSHCKSDGIQQYHQTKHGEYNESII